MGIAPRSRFIVFAAIVVVVVLIGISGYWIISKNYEENPATGADLFVNAIYWSVVTLSTLGSYPGGVELTSSVGKLFTVLTVIFGISTIFIAFPLAISPLLEERMKRIIKPKTMPIPLEEHVIICGYSELGKEVINDLKMHNVNFVVIENDESKIKELSEENIPFVEGDPSEEKVLEKANIHSALSLVTVSDDSLNAFICLTAKKIAPKIRIVSNVQNTDNIKLLKRAGAETVISPKFTAGILLGRQVISDNEFDITNTLAFFGNLEIRQHPITKTSFFIGKTINGSKIRNKTGVLIIGIWKNGKLQLNPLPEQILEDNDILLVMGNKNQINRLKEVL